MSKWKSRVLASVLAVSMALSMNGMPVLASANTNEGTSQTSGTDIEPTATNTDAVNADTENQEATSEEVTSVEVEEDTAANLINYLVTESDYVTAPADQFVLVDVGDGSKALSSATLYYTNETTGANYEKAVDTIDATSLVFNLSFASAADAGKYNLTSLTYTFEDGQTYTENLVEIGLGSEFGVNTEVEADPDLWLVDENTDSTNADVSIDTSVVSKGNSAASVEQALANADASVSDGISSRNSIVNGASSDGKYVIVIDPGHGGNDSGCYNTYGGVNIYEKNLTLKIANYMRAELQKYSNFTVYLTREGDGGLSSSAADELSRRCNFAASVNADAYVSIHVNTEGNNVPTSANGVEIYVPNNNYNSTVSSAIGNYSPDVVGTAKGYANTILNRLIALGLTNRGLKIRNSENGSTYADGSLADYHHNIWHNKENSIPAIIVEHGFLDNSSDYYNHFRTDAQLQALGIADAQGVVDYFGTSYKSVLNETDYKDVYNYAYYIAHNDLSGKVDTNNQYAVLSYFVNYGMDKGDVACSTFDVHSYRNEYEDLRAAFGSNWRQYYLHYIGSGKREGRHGTGCTKRVGSVTVLNGVDYSPVFDADYYLDRYPDLKAAFGDNDEAALQHFVYFGMKEGRQGNASFDVKSYKNRYVDLRYLFGYGWTNYFIHYLYIGRYEGRSGAYCADRVGYISIYNGVDYASIYNADYYINNNPDVKIACGNDDTLALYHFVVCGIKEGRSGDGKFYPKDYRERYPDLRSIFGTNWINYCIHYMTFGKKEGRSGAPLKYVNGYLAEMNGVDYSAEYDGAFYRANNPDLEAACGNDSYNYLLHYVLIGKKEGRLAKAGVIPGKYNYTSKDDGLVVRKLQGYGYSSAGISAIMGNLYAESGIRANNLQNNYESSLGSDDAYTAAVDNGSISRDSFANDHAGYGVAQWTFWSRKAALYDYAKVENNTSIADLSMQIDFLVRKELVKYADLNNYLKTTTDVNYATDRFAREFERPAVYNQATRQSYSNSFYNTYFANK